MKKIFLTLSFIITVFILAQAQGGYQHKNYEQFKAQKIAFITEKLELTPEEAQVFWPIFNEYEKKQDKILSERRTMNGKCMNSQDTFSEEEFVKMADVYIQSRIDEAKLLEEYHAKFKKVLSAKKVVMLYHTEHEFKRHLLHKLRRGKGYGRTHINDAE